METLIVSIIGYAFILIAGIAIGMFWANRIESPEFKAAKINAFDMIYYDSMSRKYSAMAKELDKENTPEYLHAADKEATFRDQKAKSKAAYEADAAKLSERDRSILSDYIRELEYKSDDLEEKYDKV